MGPSPRGGAYTYDWIENLLGLNMHSADHVLPEFQHPRTGDGFGYGANAMTYAIVELEQVLATRSADGNWVWTEHGSHDPQTDVNGDDPILTGKIALAHMKEFPDYYDRLEVMKAEAGRDWAAKAHDDRST